MLVNTKEQLSAVLEDLKKCKEIAFDFETTALHHKTMEVLGISFCGDALLTSVYVDLSSASGISKFDGWAAVNSIFKLDATFIAHNYVFDGKVLHHFYKAYPEKVFDTMVAAWYLDENRESFGLKQLAKQILKLDMTKYKDVDKDDIEAFAKYGAMDAYATYELYKIFSGELAANPKANALFQELEMQFLEVLIDITLSGFLMDQEYLVNMASSLRVNRDILKEKLEKDLGGININSTQQLCKALYGIEVSRKGGKLTMTKVDGGLVQPKLQTKSGAPATSDAALEKLDHPIIDRLREYRGVEKLLTTYAEGYQRFIVDGKIYPNFNPIGTVTGRLSCNDPNCFSGDTEVLTKNGWVRFDTLQKGVEVAQWDFGSVSFVQPKEYVEYTTDRPLIHIYNTHIDLLVTMDHRCLLQNRKTGKNRVVEAKNYMEDYRQLHSGWFVFGNTKLSKDFVVLLAATQADGYFTSSKKTDFVFFKKRKIERLLDSLSSLGIRPYVRAKGEATRITLGHKETLLIKEYLGNEKVFGPWVLDLDIETATLLSEEVYFWDGCYKRKTMYSSNIQQNVDWIQILHTLTNKRAKIREYQGIKNVNYQIDVTKNNYSLTTNIQKESVDGTSRVYCVSVPSSYLLVRRNGKTAVTGNCQNLPRAATDGWFIRDAFICPEGYDLIVADESQLELRLLAHFSKDPALMEAFLSEGDVHTRTASQIFRKPMDAITKEERQSSKTINFGIMYGMGPQKLADSLKITESQAKFLLQQYFETYEGVHEWFNTVETYAKRNGYVKTIIGRTRNLPDIWSRDRALYSRARRQAVNSVIQGSAADILKVAMVKIRQELKDRGLDATILSQIHDELVVQSLCSQSEEVAEVIKTYMEHPFSKELAVPLIVEPKIVKRWSDGK